MRTVGQVTAVVIGRSLTWLNAPIMDHDKRSLALIVQPGMKVIGLGE